MSAARAGAVKAAIAVSARASLFISIPQSISGRPRPALNFELVELQTVRQTIAGFVQNAVAGETHPPENHQGKTPKKAANPSLKGGIRPFFCRQQGARRPA